MNQSFYRTLIYEVDYIKLKIDEYNPDITKLTNDSFCIITAYNQHGILQSVLENESQHRSLRDMIDSFSYIETVCGKTSSYIGEPSYFIIGISKEYSIYLGTLFNQNAIVYGNEYDKIPRLIMLR